MNAKAKCKVLFLFCIAGILHATAQKRELQSARQTTEMNCGLDSKREELFKTNPEAKKDADNFEKFLQKPKLSKGVAKAAGQYTIPVVFHVFGNSFAGKTVTDEIIKDALKKTNEDFQGRTADWNTVDPDFVAVRKALDISFELANLDPFGNPTTGIRYYGTKSGFGGIGVNIEDQIRRYAWDNYKYCNVYIMLDLYNNGETTNSGVAWLPSKWMSDNNIARVVYNGRYLGTNTSENFRSVLTHEFGHYLGLDHTFFGKTCPDPGSCSETGDRVCDTPPASRSNMNGALNCLGQKTNWQNFMDYSDNYAMFTKGQVDLMEIALDHESRKTLWQTSNLTVTGVNGAIGPNISYSNVIFSENIGNDGTVNTELNVIAREGVRFRTTSNKEFQENVHFSVSNLPSGLFINIFDVTENSLKIKLLGKASNHDLSNSINNLGITFTNNAFVSHSASQIKGVNNQNIWIEYLDPYQFHYESLEDNNEIIVDGNAWDSFSIGKSLSYGLQWDNSIKDDERRLKLETFSKGIIVSDIRDIVALSDGDIIDGNANWVDPNNIATGDRNTVLVRDGYNDWKGKIAYAGISFSIDGRPQNYGWMRIMVSEDGTRARVIDYAYKEEPGASIKAGEVPAPMLSATKVIVYESQSNNGTIVDEVDFILQGNESFKNIQTLNEGTHYSVSGLPKGLTTQITRTGANKATLKMLGNAVVHDQGDSNAVTIKFSDAAFAGNDSDKVKNAVFSLQVRFMNSYKIVHRKFGSPVVVDAKNNLDRINLETEENTFWQYGLIIDDNDNNSLKILADGKGVIINNTTKEIIPLAEGTVINSSSTFFTSHFWTSRSPVLSSPSFTTLNGKITYVGIRFKDPAARTHYGWIKYEISSDGKSAKLLEAAYNSEPNKSITVGETGSDVPCFSGASLGRSQHLQTFRLGDFTQTSNIPSSFTDNTSKTIKVRPGIVYPLSATHSYKDISNSHWFNVWIDLNKDNDFEDAGELVYSVDPFKGEHRGEITIPNVLGTYKLRVTIKNTFPTGEEPPAAPTPCDYFWWGETEDYTINISSSNPLPPVSDFTASSTSLIQKDFITFTDQSSFSPTSWNWSFPGGVPSSSTKQNPVVTYNEEGTFDVTLVVTNTDGSSTLVKSNYVTVSKQPDDYCTPEHGNSEVRYIENVKFETIDNSSGVGLVNGYSDYTGQTTTVEAGKTYSLDVKTKSIAWATYAQNRLVAWIDFNKNNSFGDSERIIQISATEELANGGVYPTSQISIPVNIPTGNYRMRIRHLWLSNDFVENPCNDVTGEGETEDYIISVINNQTPDVPTAPSNLTSSNITQTSADLSWTASTILATNQIISYDVYNGNLKIANVANTSYTVTGLNSDTVYAFTIKAITTNGKESDSSNVHSFRTLKPVATYCAAQSTNSNYESISNVQFGSIDNASVSTGYGNYIDVKTDISIGQTTNLYITTKGNYANDEIVVFIDYNQDGDFTDSGEEVYHHNNARTAATYTASIAIPNSANPGNTRMRIVLFDILYDQKVSCGDFEYGEVEDYTINLVSSKITLPLKEVNDILMFPNPTKDVFTVQFNSDSETRKISIINMYGQVIKVENGSLKEVQVDLSEFSTGLYMVQIRTKKEVVVKQIIKE